MMKLSMATFSFMILSWMLLMMFILLLSSAAAQPSSPALPTTTTTTSNSNGNTILAIASHDANANLSTLLDLLTDEDLLYIIDGTTGTNVTVFAPTNEAFAVLESGGGANPWLFTTWAWRAHLRTILQNHLVVSVITTTGATPGMITSVTTLAGETIQISVADGVLAGSNTTTNNNIIMVDDANVILADVVADNGVIHVIDRVLTPTWWEQSLPLAVAATAAAAEDLSTLLDLLERAGLVAALSSLPAFNHNGTTTTTTTTTAAAAGPYFTIFAPTNDAFASLDDNTLACVSSNTTILTALLTYHVVQGEVLPAAQITSGSIVTWEGSLIRLDAAGGGAAAATTMPGPITVNGGANITKSDAVLAQNGIVHYIDAVLVPDSVKSFIDTCVANAAATATTRAPTAPTRSPLVAAAPLSNTSATATTFGRRWWWWSTWSAIMTTTGLALGWFFGWCEI